MGLSERAASSPGPPRRPGVASHPLRRFQFFCCTLSQRLAAPRGRASLVLRNEALVLRARAPASTVGCAEYGAVLASTMRATGMYATASAVAGAIFFLVVGDVAKFPHGLLGSWPLSGGRV